MGTTSKPYDGVAVTAPITIPYTRYSERGATWFIGRALAEMIKAASIEKADIDGLAVSSFTLAPDSVVALTEHFSMSPRWLEHLPMGGASGVIAMRRAARAVQAADAEIVACIGGDTCHPGSFRQLVATFSRFSEDAVYPYGAGGPNSVFALITQAYMDEYGATREDFGRLCVAQRTNAQQFPYALFRQPLSLDEYLNARPIAEPLHLFDCVMPCAGADGFLVMSVDRARSLGLPYVTILSAVERHNAYVDDAVQLRGGWAIDSDQLYASAGLGPEGIDCIETYDDYPVVSMLQLEDLGFCQKGEAAQFVRNTPLTCDGGGLPHNTSGGQLSVGQAGSAGGFLGLVEGLRQVTGQALGGQVEDAHTGLISGFGMVNYDRGLGAAATIIQQGK
ncbi:MAG: thiolase family protein [Pseudomonadota bacterium]|nr:thiolase family protein [Pseudomonadota bacterium]